MPPLSLTKLIVKTKPTMICSYAFSCASSCHWYIGMSVSVVISQSRVITFVVVSQCASENCCKCTIISRFSLYPHFFKLTLKIIRSILKKKSFKFIYSPANRLYIHSTVTVAKLAAGLSSNGDVILAG